MKILKTLNLIRQSFYLNDKIFTFQFGSMTSLQSYYSLRQNFSPIGKNKFTRKAQTKNSRTSTFITTFFIFYASTIALIFAFALNLVFSRNMYIDVNLEKSTKLALELFIQGQAHV